MRKVDVVSVIGHSSQPSDADLTGHALSRINEMLTHPFPCDVCHQSLADVLCNHCEAAICGGCARQHNCIGG